MEKEFRQDGPPKGGYKPIIYKGIFPNRGSLTLFSLVHYDRLTFC
jgi:hypothetical protein